MSMKIKYANPQAKAQLSGVDLNWLRFDKADPATLVKENALRKVWRVATSEGIFYVKQHFRRGIQPLVKDAIVNPPALIEFQRAAYAEQYHIRATRILAWGSGFDPDGVRVCFTVSPELENASPFPVLFEEAIQSLHVDQLNGLMKALAVLLAESHIRGFLHRDVHADNILISPQSDEDEFHYHAWYVDLQHCDMEVEISQELAARNIAELNQWFETRAPFSLRMRFLREYLRIRFKEDSPAKHRQRFRSWLRLVIQFSERHASRLYGKRDRRILGQNEFYGGTRLSRGWRGHYTLQFRRRDRWPYPTQPDQTLLEWIAWTRRLMPALADACGCEVVMYREGLRTRRWTPRSITHELEWLLFGSPAKRMFRKLHKQRNREQRVSPPIAYFERHWCGQPVECFIILEGQPKTRKDDHENRSSNPEEDHNHPGGHHHAEG